MLDLIIFVGPFHLGIIYDSLKLLNKHYHTLMAIVKLLCTDNREQANNSTSFWRKEIVKKKPQTKTKQQRSRKHCNEASQAMVRTALLLFIRLGYCNVLKGATEATQNLQHKSFMQSTNSTHSTVSTQFVLPANIYAILSVVS